MIDLEIIHPDGRHQPLSVPDMCSIGKGSQCEVRLDNWRLAKEHARLFTSPSGVLIDDAGSFGGVLVNGQRITAQYGPLQNGDLIGIGPFQLRILNSGEEPQAAAFPVPAAAHAATTAPMQSTQDTALAVPADAPEPAAAEPGEAHFQALQFEWRKRLHTKLIDTMDLRRHDVSSMSDEHLRAEADRLIARTLQDMDDEIPAQLDRNALRRQVLDEAVGLGPLEELLADETVSEIMVNRFDEIYVERAGRLQKHALSFTSDRAVMGVIERIVAPLGRRIDESSPMVDARLKDGSRVNAIIAPLALKGSTLTIRKFARRKLNAADLVQFGALSPAMADFLRICVEARKNIIVSGGTGSGKTTLLNILSNFIPSGERVITVEDAAELKLAHEHLISLESRPANVEGKGGVPIRELVRNTLRMRPDRIVVGECRGAEALDMLQAMNTGHEGSLTTLHANTPREGSPGWRPWC